MVRSTMIDTLHRLQYWKAGSGDSERMASLILMNDGYELVEPSNPTGGKDAGKDIKCMRDGITYFVAVYFPHSPVTVSSVEKKWDGDLGKIADNVGFIFITNQEIPVSRREKWIKESNRQCVVYDLERLASCLNRPMNFGARLEFLSIEMNKEEQVAFLSVVTGEIAKLNKFVSSNGMSASASRSLPSVSASPLTSTLRSHAAITEKLHYCSSCRRGKWVHDSAYSVTIGPIELICPYCENSEIYKTFMDVPN